MIRDRTTAIDVTHTTIHEINEAENKINFEPYGLGYNSEVYKVKTFENTYILKKIKDGSIERLNIKKKLISYLNKDEWLIAPQIYFFWEKKNNEEEYLVEIMQFMPWKHLKGKDILSNKDSIIIFFDSLSKKLDNYYKDNYNIKIQSLRDKIINWIANVDCILNDIDKIMLFLENNKLQQSVVYYDIHSQNILFNNKWIYIVDLDPFLIWPKIFQFACLLIFFMLEDIDVNSDIDIYIKNWWNVNDLRILMKLRCLIWIIFFSKKNKKKPDDNNLLYLNKYLDIYNRIVID